MKAWVLQEHCEVETKGGRKSLKGLIYKKKPLSFKDMETPQPGDGEILIKISACGVCHTELDIIEGRRDANLPVIPGHEVIGKVESLGPNAQKYKKGDRVGVAWIYSSDGTCSHCKKGEENLCDNFKGAGSDADGGYAQYMKVHEKFAYKIPDTFSDHRAAPLMCAGAIGYRSLNLTELKNGQNIALFGFGASAHIVIQLVRHKYPDSDVFVFTRGESHAELAKKLGAKWTGKPDAKPPEKIHKAIDFTPVGETEAKAMSVLEKGGRLVINAIRKRSPVVLDYAEHMWLEKEIKSVANITPSDVEEFLPLAAEIPIKPEIQLFDFKDANRALRMLKQGEIQGAGVLDIGE